MNASDVRSNWSQLLNQVFRGETEVVVEKSGIPVAVLVSSQDYKTLQWIKKQREQDFVVIESMRASFKDQTTEQILEGVKKSIAEVRAENRKKKLHSV